MPTFGYTKSAPVSFDVSRQVQAQQALDLRKDEMEQRRAMQQQRSQEQAMGKVGKLDYGWAKHNPVIVQAWKENLAAYGKAVRTGDSKAANEALERFEDIRSFASASKQQGQEVAMWDKAVLGKPNGFVTESKQQFDQWKGAQAQQFSTDGNGTITYQGEYWGKDGQNPLLNTPQVMTATQGFFETFRKANGDNSFMKNGSSGTYFDKEAFDEVFSVSKGEAMKYGMDGGDIDMSYDAALKYYNRGNKPYWKPDSGDGSGKNKEEKFTYNVGTENIDAFKFDVGNSKFATGTVPSISLTYSGDKSEPMKNISYYDKEAKENRTYPMNVKKIYQVGDGKYFAEGVGYKQEGASEWDLDGDGGKVRSKQQIRFEIDDKNKADIELLYLQGQKIEDVFGGSKKKIGEKSDPLGLGI